jgi:hypothetical protein
MGTGWQAIKPPKIMTLLELGLEQLGLIHDGTRPNDLQRNSHHVYCAAEVIILIRF